MGTQLISHFLLTTKEELMSCGTSLIRSGKGIGSLSYMAELCGSVFAFYPFPIMVLNIALRGYKTPMGSIL